MNISLFGKFPYSYEQYFGHKKINLNVSHFELFFSLVIPLLPDFDHNSTIRENGLFYDLNWYLILFDYCVRIYYLC